MYISFQSITEFSDNHSQKVGDMLCFQLPASSSCTLKRIEEDAGKGLSLKQECIVCGLVVAAATSQ